MWFLFLDINLKKCCPPAVLPLVDMYASRGGNDAVVTSAPHWPSAHVSKGGVYNVPRLGLHPVFAWGLGMKLLAARPVV